AGVLLHADDRGPGHRRGGSRRVLLPLLRGRKPLPAPDVILASHTARAGTIRSGRRVRVSARRRPGARCEPRPDAMTNGRRRRAPPDQSRSEGLLVRNLLVTTPAA